MLGDILDNIFSDLSNLLANIVQSIFAPFIPAVPVATQQGTNGQNATVYSQSFDVLTKAQIDTDAWNKFVALIKDREGYSTVTYADSLGKLSGGIGHLIVSGDGFTKVNQPIPQSTIDSWFLNDSAKAFAAAQNQADTLGEYTADFIAVLASVNFQLGTNWTSTFYGTWAQLKAHNWDAAISHIQATAWAKQTPVRAQDFINAINKLKFNAMA